MSLRALVTTPLALTMLVVPAGPDVAPAAAAPLPPGGMSAAALNTEFNSYGNTGGGWTSGDSTVSIPLPDGRNVWLFSDSLIGAVDASGGLPSNTPMINNSLVVQDGANLVETRHSGTATAPESLVKPADGGADKYWVGDGTVEGDVLRVVYQRMRSLGSGPLDFALVDSAVVTFDLPALTVRSVADRGFGDKIAWGSAVLEDGGYTYIYGAEDAGQMRFSHLARVPAGGLAGAWQFWTGWDWSASHTASARILSGVGAGFGVQRIGGSYVLTTQETNLTFSPDFVAYTAPSPIGPFTGPISLFTAPEQANIEGSIVYDARPHPELALTGKLLISYNVNNLRPGAVFEDVTRYRPRFVEVDWPRPTPDPALLPAAPTGLSARAGLSGDIYLAWQPPAGGSGLTYSVHQRDVTAGQTHFAGVAAGVTATNRKLEGFYADGHTYEFRVAAVNAAGAGPQSAPATALVTITPPAAPTGLTAVAADGGAVTLTWNAVPDVWRYEVFRRDVTTGESGPAREWDAVPYDTTHTTTGLPHGHTFEFHVVAIHGGGQSPPSAVVTATAFYNRPAAVTGLSATAQHDGSIKLGWAHPGNDLWFSVYQRDVTAGEADFTKLEWPVMTCCSMVAGGLADGHTYEYRVTATNRGGESAASSTASATARYPLPLTPTGLTATAQPDGSVTLTWQHDQSDAWYYVHQRDVTAGEAEFTKLEWPVMSCCTMSAGGLIDGHTYAFVVSAATQAGESAVSAQATVVADRPVPAPPANLQAIAGNGQVTLTWEGSSDNWHLVSMRDVTAGDTVFTQLDAPVTTCCTMTAGYLTNGHQYEFKVAAVGEGGESAPSGVATATPVSPKPDAPAGLAAAAQPDGTIRLSWLSSGADHWYLVYMRDVTAGQTSFTKVADPVTTCCTMTAGYLANGHTYEFKLSAVNSGGEGPTGGVASATSNQPRPGAPANLRGQSAGQAAIELTWDAPGAGLIYWVYQRDVTAGEAAFTKSVYPSDSTSATRGFLSDGHVYEFKVTAESQGGEGPASGVIQVTARGGVPQAPSNLAAVPGDGKATLTWTASPTSGAWYQVYIRNVSDGQSWQRLASPVTTCCTTVAGYLTNNDVYEFKITALNGAGESTATAVVRATPKPPAPTPPSNLTATPGNGQAVLRWSASATPNVYYDVYLRDTTAGQAWKKIDLPVSTCCSMTAGYLTNGHRYEFKVAASNMGGQSATTNVADATPLPPFPQAPSGLTAGAGDGKVTLRWSASSTADVYYLVEYRIAGSSSWTRVMYPVSSCCTFVAGYLQNGKTYEFRVRASNVAGDSTASNVASARPMPPFPQPPSGLSATAGDRKVTLRWTASPTANVYYWIEYKAASSSTWTRVQYPDASCCTFVAGYLTNGITYQFRIRATNMTGDSSPSGTASARPTPPVPNAPTNLAVTTWLSGDKMFGWATVAWRGSTNTTSVVYQLHYRNVTRNSGWSLGYIGGATSNSSSFYNGDELYEIRISAENSAGSTYSATKAFTAKRSKPSLYFHLTDAYSRADWEEGKRSPNQYSEYGFNWNDDGCSHPLGGQFGYGNAYFDGACQRHDFGYRNHGSWGVRKAIDDTFLFDMNTLCLRELFNERTWCERSAQVYYQGVRSAGGAFW